MIVILFRNILEVFRGWRRRRRRRSHLLDSSPLS